MRRLVGRVAVVDLIAPSRQEAVADQRVLVDRDLLDGPRVALGQARSTQSYQAADDGKDEELLERMKALAAKRPRFGQDRITVLLGPAAAGRHYELPDDLADEVEAALPGSRTRTAAGTAGVDLRVGITRQLAGLGVTRVDSDPRCTIADETLFSYRRQGRTGRQASVIWRTA